MSPLSRVSLLALSALAFTVPAAAHISLELGGTHKSRYGDGFLKEGPCGKAGGARGTNIYTYEPGQTITVTFKEFIPHPGYFRFAFDNDGDNDFVTPKSIDPVDKTRACPMAGGIDQCGQADYYNSPTVLPGMDNLDPHMAGAAKNYTYQVKLPDVECTNCTLQVIQVMEDNAFHGPYTPGPNAKEGLSYVDDVYYQCIDIVLKRGGGTGSGGAPSGNGGASTTGGAPTTGSGGAGGTPTTGNGGAGGVPTTLTGGTTSAGGTMPANGGAPTANGGAPTANGGAPTANGGATAMGGAAMGGMAAMGGAAVAPTSSDDDGGGCGGATIAARAANPTWAAALAALGLIGLARRFRR